MIWEQERFAKLMENVKVVEDNTSERAKRLAARFDAINLNVSERSIVGQIYSSILASCTVFRQNLTLFLVFLASH